MGANRSGESRKRRMKRNLKNLVTQAEHSSKKAPAGKKRKAAKATA